ncbi:MAG TPA: ATP-binding protein [Kofleriaceae bacterium]|nr:ATP-binding protein [Kofleriaceae bacterium]
MKPIKTKRPLPLQLKLTVALVLIVMTPLAVSAYFIGQLGRAAANVAAGEASARTEILDRSIDAYHDLVRTKKDLHHEIGRRLAQRADLIAAVDGADVTAELQKLVTHEPGLRAIAVLRPDGTAIAEAARPPAGSGWRDIEDYEPLGADQRAVLRLTFEVSATINDDLQRLKQSIDATRTFVQIKTALPAGYRTAFLVMIGIAGLVAAAFGFWASTRVTRRIESLVVTARKVSDGHVDARVELRGHDEMAELGSAFNTMLDDLDQTRRQVEYLQRMGVWQDVARRLAHEIKNPLTPIQLAVQQCVSAYKGDDPKFKRLLADTGEIVQEESAGLRRLVDTFRTLGALPKVEASPIALADVIQELKLDPTFAPRLTLVPPLEPVTVRADKLLLKRVLVNLVENGVHAGQEAGTEGDVTISWSASGDVAVISVDDRGKGVAPDARDKIFEPYVTTKSTGTGLGLAIAKKLAIEHGGELAIAPERAPTGGARFVITLPTRRADTSQP